ncbi:MAG: gephyrin-like molybdotransferase Glp [Gemmatimonadota bacterium]
MSAKNGGAAADWVSYARAYEIVLEHCRRLGSEIVPIDRLLGRALAQEIRSRVSHPPWNSSAMDGFAVRAEDLGNATPQAPVSLPLSGESPAGAEPPGPLRHGSAVKVMTGAPVPEGASGVVRIEHTDGGRRGRVTFFRTDDANRNIRRAGEDIRRGDLLLGLGDTLTPAAIGALALTGQAEARVGRVPQVGVLASGDELVDMDARDAVLAGRKIMNTNSVSLAAQVRSAGADPLLLGIARDEPSDLRDRLRRLDECDALITAGGVSVGERDYVKPVLEEMGMRRLFWRVRIRPGSALLFGVANGRPIWGVPGNPVSAMVTFELFVRPALRKLAGHARFERSRSFVRSLVELNTPTEVRCFYRAILRESTDDLPGAELTGPQGSGNLMSMVDADGLLVVPEGIGRVEPGMILPFIRLRSWRAAGSGEAE